MRKKAGYALRSEEVGDSRVRNVEVLTRGMRIKKDLDVYVFVRCLDHRLAVEINFMDDGCGEIQGFELENTLSVLQIMHEGITLDPEVLEEVPPEELFCKTVGQVLAKKAELTFEEDPHQVGGKKVIVRLECGRYSDSYAMSTREAVVVFDFDE